MTKSSAGRPPALPAELVAVLRFAAHHANADTDALTAAVREAFGCNLLRYYQRLNVAVHMPGAAAVEPVIVRLLLERLERRRRFRRPATRQEP